MKLRTVLALAGGLAIGYVVGTAAGRGRFEELKQRGGELLHDPKVQQTVFDIADQVKANTERIPAPVADLIDTAATRVQENLTHPDDTAPQTTTQT